MKKITFLFAFIMLAAFSFAQNQYPPLPANQDWKPGNQVNPNRATNDVFLQGNFVEIGIAPGGSCGTTNGACPGGYHNWGYYSGNLGFVSDYDQNGWTVGTPPYSGDYFLPGTPWEAWLCEFTFGGIDYTFINSDACSFFGVPPTSLTNTSVGSTHSATWVGTATAVGQSLMVEQKFHFVDNDAKFIIDVKLTNVGPDPLESVEYARAVDPDQEEDWTGNFTTSNYVAHQPDGSNNIALVVGMGLNYGIPMGLMLVHPSAKAHVIPDYRLEIYTPDEPLDNTYAPTQGAPRVADCGVAVAMRVPVLNPGQSVSFPVAYVLNMDEIINPPNLVPISNWAIYLLVGLIVLFTVIRFRRMS